MGIPSIKPVNNIDFKKILEQTYWIRITRSNVRIKQALEYGCSKMNLAIGKNLFVLPKYPRITLSAIFFGATFLLSPFTGSTILETLFNTIFSHKYS